jgi:hypothetical protein
MYVTAAEKIQHKRKHDGNKHNTAVCCVYTRRTISSLRNNFTPGYAWNQQHSDISHLVEHSSSCCLGQDWLSYTDDFLEPAPPPETTYKWWCSCCKKLDEKTTWLIKIFRPHGDEVIDTSVLHHRSGSHSQWDSCKSGWASKIQYILESSRKVCGGGNCLHHWSSPAPGNRMNLQQTLGMGFRWKFRSMLGKSKSSRPNMSKNGFKGVRSLRFHKDNRILLADKASWF